MKKGKIVLVEDDKILSKVVYEELSDEGFEVSNAYDGEEALKIIKSEKPDLILLDLVLPKKHGFDVLAQLKQSPDTKDIPVIIITMLGSDEDIKKGIQLGADDYIVKAQHAVAEIVEKVSGFFDKMHASGSTII
ncbi:response regulator transcription factor [Patescibacteria group bacterium]